jgi:regulator of sigma D
MRACAPGWKREPIYQLERRLDSLTEAISGQVQGPIFAASLPIAAQIHVSCVREVSFLKLRTCHLEVVVVIYAPDTPTGTGEPPNMEQCMSSEAQEQRERRSGTRTLIDKMLTERQRMLVLFERVAGVEPYADEMPNNDLLQEFSQILVDYIASGHFGLYERIAEGKERRRGIVKLADELYPRIANTTQAAIEFNDVCETANGDSIGGNLSNMLSKLGEEIAVRIELEDQLISEMIG